MYAGSDITKSSGSTSCTGVDHLSAGFDGFSWLSINRAMAAAVKDLDVLAQSKSVFESNLRSENCAWPKYYSFMLDQ